MKRLVKSGKQKSVSQSINFSRSRPALTSPPALRRQLRRSRLKVIRLKRKGNA